MTKEEKEALREKQKESGRTIGIHNLIPITQRPPEEQKEIRQKGAMVTNEIRRHKKDIKEICDAILALDGKDIAKGNVSDDLIEKMEAVGMTSIYEVIVAKQAQNAIQGSTKAAEYIRDSSGDKPKTDIDMDLNVITDSDRALLANLSDRIDALEAIDDTTS